MRKIIVLAAASVFLPALAWADQATVASGEKSEITTHMRYDRHCKANPVAIKVVAAPAHGSVTAAKTIVVPKQSERGMRQQVRCVGKTVEGVAVYYQSEPGYVGQDQFRYLRLNPKDGGDKFNMEVSYTITVKQAGPDR